MQRLNSVSPESAQGKTKTLMDEVQQTFGMVPNTVRVMAGSPAVLESFLAFTRAMGGAGIGDRLSSQVKLSTSEANSCDYCTAILCAVAPAAGLTADDIVAGRTGQSDDQHTAAALSFAAAVLANSGRVSDDQLRAVRQAGFSDSAIVEIVASVVLGCFTNFLNNVADTELDIPPAKAVTSGSDSTCITETCHAG